MSMYIIYIIKEENMLYGTKKRQCLTMSNSIFTNSHLGLRLWAQAPKSVNVHMFFTYQRHITHIKQDNNITIVSYNTTVSTEWHGQL